jgi:hypothetical protein
MKAQDVTTPGDYEVRPYKDGERKATISKVEKRTVRVYPDGSFDGHDSLQWRAIEEYEDNNGTPRELEYPLGQIVRPWSEAAAEHEAATQFRSEGERVAARLADALKAQDLGQGADPLSNGGLVVRVTREQADRLAELLEQSAL